MFNFLENGRDIDVYIMLLLFLNKKKKRTPGGFPTFSIEISNIVSFKMKI